MTRDLRRRIALLALAVMLAAAPARAHDQPFSYANLTLAPPTVELSLSLHPIDAATVGGFAKPDTLMGAMGDAGSAAAARTELGKRLAERMHIDADGTPIVLTVAGTHLRADRPGVVIDYRAPLARMPGRVRFAARLVPSDPQHETFVNLYEGKQLVRQEVLDATHTETLMFTEGAEGLFAVVRTFVAAGVHHIFIGPDHILFVIGLLLLGGSVGRILKIVTAFTLAHSVTLALAAFQIVNPPSRLVEPLIALSIVYVGLENLRSKPGARDPRVLIAFGFGFVHGFGFASVLREFGLPREALAASLFAFNAGVEIGQACIVLAVLPLLALLRTRAPQLAPRVVFAGSVGVVLAGSYWFAQRVFFPS